MITARFTSSPEVVLRDLAHLAEHERRDLLERERLPPSRTAAAPSSPAHDLVRRTSRALLHHGASKARPTSRFAP